MDARLCSFRPIGFTASVEPTIIVFMKFFCLQILLIISVTIGACNDSEEVVTEKGPVVMELKFKTDYPEGAASLIAKLDAKAIDQTEFSKGVLEGHYTLDEIKFWITQVDYTGRTEYELSNDEVLLACSQYLGKYDTKWMLKFYFETLYETKMLAQEGSAEVLDDSWLPNKGKWMIVSPNDGFVYPDAVLSKILYGWNRQKNFQMLAWCKLLETDSIKNTFNSGVKNNALLLKLKRK